MDNDNDVREMLTQLTLLSEPNNIYIYIYFDLNKDGFNKRDNIQLKKINNISLRNNLNIKLYFFI